MAYRSHVLICAGAACISTGEPSVKESLIREIQKFGLTGEVKIVETGCVGSCDLGPVMIVYPDEVFYQKVKPEDVPDIVEEHLLKGRVVERLLIKSAETDNLIATQREFVFFNRQMKVVLENCGLIDPEVVEEYIGRGGYLALGRVLTEMTPADVIDVITKSGLRGRGGAGFPTGMKWNFVARAEGSPKYVVCNADEGDPGAFMDRSIIEGDPHRIIEGMAIAGYACGASKGYVYVRAEYPLAIQRLSVALDSAREMGFLGENIFETGFNFDIEIRIGAGAFVCGEETALLASIEGKRGMPRPKPPFPANEGLWGKPTLINNVETYANVPPIIMRGPEWFSSIGTEKSKGTKVFALAGKIRNTGLVEVPMGTTLREIVFNIGGGIPDGKRFKAAQTGGPSGGCIPEQYLDVPMDYESLLEIGAMMGSGGLIIMDEDSCMVDVAKYFISFCVEESCGKCVPCRAGTKQMEQILERITQGKGKTEDLDRLEELGLMMKEASLCGLGQTAPNPVLSTIRHFRDEYEAHINEKKCPAKVCKPLIRFEIDYDKCVGCSRCFRACPQKTIFKYEGERKYYIDQSNCIKCGVCFDVCRFDAVSKE